MFAKRAAPYIHIRTELVCRGEREVVRNIQILNRVRENTGAGIGGEHRKRASEETIDAKCLSAGLIKPAVRDRRQGGKRGPRQGGQGSCCRIDLKSLNGDDAPSAVLAKRVDKISAGMDRKLKRLRRSQEWRPRYCGGYPGRCINGGR